MAGRRFGNDYFSEWSKGFPRHSVKRKGRGVPEVLLVRQQETVPGPDGLSLLHVVELMDITPAFQIAVDLFGNEAQFLISTLE